MTSARKFCIGTVITAAVVILAVVASALRDRAAHIVESSIPAQVQTGLISYWNAPVANIGANLRRFV